VRRRWPALLLLLFTAACEPEARRLLVLDLTLSDPLTLDATAAPWHAAGYNVEYRRYYPHLTRQDLARYRSVLVLGGRSPGGRSDALTIGDLAILNEWIRRDGVVVLAYTDGELDRWVMNQWLAAQGAGIDIGSATSAAPATPLPHSALDNAGFAAFPAGRNRPLQVRDRSQTLARGPALNSALVAASRVGDGLIVVASRSLLASESSNAGTRTFLEALARWTRRPAEWAVVSLAVRPLPLHLANAPEHLAIHPPELAPPKGAEAVSLPAPSAGTPATADVPLTTPNWIARQGMRVLWTRFALPSLDSLLRFVDLAALNALATTIPMQAVIDTISTRALWKITAERMQATSIRWFPAIALVAIPSEGADEVDRHGELTPMACGLDSLFWRGGLRPVLRSLTRLGIAGGTTTGSGGRIEQQKTDFITGIALDLDSATTGFSGGGFCDADYRVGLSALGLERAEFDRLAVLPPVVRYDTLLERGSLARYFQGLEDEVAARAGVLRGELRRLHPDLRIAFHASDIPADWFSLGLLRGFSSPDAPVLLWGATGEGGGLMRRYRARGIFALSALGLEPDRATFATAELPRLHVAAFSDHAGFWLDGAATDSLGRVIRRFVK
jgi:hypothetical protein